MNECTIRVIENTEINWDKVSALHIENYPWYETGKKQDTQVKVVIHVNAVKLKVYCEDMHSYSETTELNGDVYLDSCFEFFVSPQNKLGSAYFNFEINCCGVLHLGYKSSEVENSRLCTKEEADRITIIPSIKTKTKAETSEDKSWELTIEIPLSLMEDISGEKITLDTWYGNFYRCGGKTEPQYATWNTIEWEFPNFHLPKQFGKLVIKKH